MGETITFDDGLSIAELDSEVALALPSRDLMSLVNINIGPIAVVNAISVSGAMNVLSGGSTAFSGVLTQVSLGQYGL